MPTYAKARLAPEQVYGYKFEEASYVLQPGSDTLYFDASTDEDKCVCIVDDDGGEEMILGRRHGFESTTRHIYNCTGSSLPRGITWRMRDGNK